jgi:hypothetical protein
MSMKRIAASLSVSPSSVHAWTRDVPLPPELEGPIPGRIRLTPEQIRARAEAWSEMNRARRRAWQQDGRAAARRDDPAHQAGCMLFWAEGSKDRNVLQLGNSDPHLMRAWIGFVRRFFGIPDERFRLNLNFYTGNGLSIDEIERFWLGTLDLPATCARTHIVDHFPTSSSGRQHGRLPYGVARLTAGDTAAVQHIYGAIQEYGGFDEPRWLDCAPRR